MWEPNPAKADYACIKFLKIAVFLIPHLQWKCNGSSLQNINLPNCVCRNKRVEMSKQKETHFEKKESVALMMFLCKKVKGKENSPSCEAEKKLVITKTADTGYKRVCVRD